ncbi:uncharacterized protein LOC131160984 [Malania oleifera]|uniref:uncharacterized protein LOC131160984 n=1 Tax=Malania oleifera TaxID=397392 RepID=UPI0025ADEDD6|nr:uncharacterized protein LOC131160984 [Malania oleifera]
MQRSSSTSRVSAYDYYLHAPPPSSAWMRTPSYEGRKELLPLHDPLPGAISEAAKRERLRAKFAENAVHVIPLVLIFCALVLWLFSNPDVNIGIKSDSIAARIEGLTIEGSIDTDTDGTQTGFLPAVEMKNTNKS